MGLYNLRLGPKQYHNEVYDADNCYLNDFPSDMRLSDNDSTNFGFLTKLGYQLYFKCILSLMYNEHKNGPVTGQGGLS